jgi:hypothetical protein
MSTYESGTQVVSLGAGVIEDIWCVGSVLSVGECLHMVILVLVQTQRRPCVSLQVEWACSIGHTVICKVIVHHPPIVCM